MRVGEIMRAVPGTIRPETTMKEAVAMMVEKKVNGLVVTDESNHVVGILSSWDIIQLVVPDYLEEDKHLAAFEAEATFEKRIAEVSATPVSEFMTKEVRTVNADDSLIQAATVLSEFRIRQLPVVDQEGLLVGYVNRTDLKLVIARILGIE